MDLTDIGSATLVEAVEQDPSDFLSVTVLTPDTGEFFVQGRCLLVGVGRLTVEVDGMPRFRALHAIDGLVHHMDVTGRVRREPGVEVALRMVIDGVYRIEPQFPATLRALPYPPPSPMW